MKKIVFASVLMLFALMLTQPAFAKITPIELTKATNTSTVGGWGEYTQVRVLDGMGRVLPNAEVYITWEISKSKGLSETKHQFTDENGRATFMLTNTEFNKNDTNFDYTVYAKYGKATANKVFTFGKDSLPRTLNLQVYEAIFIAKDNEKKPVSINLLVDDTYDITTDKNGYAYLELDTGAHSVKPVFLDISDEQNFNIKNDSIINVSIKLYSLSVRAVDDEGNPVPAQINVGSQTKKSIDAGWANFTNITKPDIVIKATYGIYKKSVQVNLDSTKMETVIFDSRPPIIKEVSPQWKEKNLQVRAVIEDGGKYASGLAQANASVDLFFIGPDKVQKRLPMYLVGYNLFEGIIPVEGDLGTIRYTVQATDADGNTATDTNTFVIPTVDKQAMDQTTQEPPTKPISEYFAIDIGALAPIVLIVAAIAALVYWYFMTRKAPSERPLKQEKQSTEYSYKEKGFTNTPSGTQAKNLSDAVPKKEPPRPPAPK
ncbi:MAG: Ig-like domain-containing protein [Candidatus Micrarchaeia archaeon]